ncbi:sterol desaturase family protein [Aurantiacibacter sp. D1-12]|uniref:sterol desaturase family protein n=1 Tax=Aurantiacibacter sp. D1-12 TaxID=2993658 RepID=UPI00237D260A|nr:sterol desaturase family protein [Aurantiacibacter sp. D1-12]MDE1467263.1 sterol desaturase family protein [Aurantiacibacter sp. D1-12]
MHTAAPIAPLAGLAVMAGVFTLLAVLELAAPFRRASQSKSARWFTNIALFALDTLAVRLLLPIAMVGAAMLAAENGWGLFNLVTLPGWLVFVVTLLALDFALWLQHVVTHRIPLLWRMHRVHHSDIDFDVSTAARFHPFEIVLSMVWKVCVVIALGAPALVVAVFEVGFAVATLITHSNLALPPRLDRAVRTLLVTPTMHRIHHSPRVTETNSNYGTALSLWDRLFDTYTAEASQPQRQMEIGLEEWRDTRTAQLGFSLWLPFVKR